MAAAGLIFAGDLSWLPPASPGASPRSASGSDPGFLQTPASLLGLRVCEILHEFFFFFSLGLFYFFLILFYF